LCLLSNQKDNEETSLHILEAPGVAPTTAGVATTHAASLIFVKSSTVVERKEFNPCIPVAA
jgi:hypothetical protein